MRSTTLALIPLSFLFACTKKVEDKTAIFVDITTQDDVVLADYASTVWIYIDPSSGGFLDATGEAYEAGLLTNDRAYSTYIGNFVEADDDLEMGIKIDLSTWSGGTATLLLS